MIIYIMKQINNHSDISYSSEMSYSISYSDISYSVSSSVSSSVISSSDISSSDISYSTSIKSLNGGLFNNFISSIFSKYSSNVYNELFFILNSLYYKLLQS